MAKNSELQQNLMFALSYKSKKKQLHVYHLFINHMEYILLSRFKNNQHPKLFFYPSSHYHNCDLDLHLLSLSIEIKQFKIGISSLILTQHF